MVHHPFPERAYNGIHSLSKQAAIIPHVIAIVGLLIKQTAQCLVCIDGKIG